MRAELEARYELEGEHAGWEGGRQLGPDGEVTVRRLTNCYSKSLSVAQLGADPVLIGFAQLGLQCDARWCAANFHDPVPTTPAAAGPSGHAPGHQALHADSGGNRVISTVSVPALSRYWATLKGAAAAVVVALDDMTEKNGR